MLHLLPLATTARPSPLWLLWTAVSTLLGLALYVFSMRQRRQRIRQVVAFGQRLGLAATADDRGAVGELAGRQVALRFESGAGYDDDELLLQLRVDLREVLGGATGLDFWVLPAWVAEAQAHARGEPPPHSSARSARLEKLLSPLRALLGAPEVLPLLGAFLRANTRTWLEDGALRASRRWGRAEPALQLQAFLDEGLALGAALTSVAHASRPAYPAEARAG